MPWPYPFGVTATVHRASIDQRTRDRSAEQDHSLEHCAYDPGAAIGTDQAGSTGSTTQPRIFAAYDADVDARTDQISLPGEVGRFDIDGDVLRHRSALTGTKACCEIRLVRRKGGA